jgi:hypothetical protein
MTTKFTNPLNNIKIASPCSQDWDAMIGDNRKRFCGECKLNVFNLSGMTKAEAENLVSNSEGRLCVRYYKRADGSVITQDCPVGWAKIKQRTKIFATAAFSLIISLFSGLLFVSLFSKQKEFGKRFPILFATPTPHRAMGAIAMPTPRNSPTPKPSATPKENMIMGEIAEPTPKRTPEREVLIGKIALPKNQIQ